MTQPLRDPNPATAPDPNRPAPAAASVPTPRPESPLASQLPAWDLVPPHTLLVRRRPVRE